MSFNLMLEAIIPSRHFLEGVFVLLESKTLYEKFDIELKSLLKSRIEANNGSLNKKELPAIYKSINKKYGISLPSFVKYFDSIIKFYKENDETTLISCFNSAKTFNNLILPDLSEEIKSNVEKGDIDFNIINKLSYKYNEYVTPKIGPENFSKYVDLVYDRENVKVYMPLTSMSFNYVLSLTKKDITWCTKSPSTWLKYNNDFACMIVIVNNESFDLPEDYSVISLKVDYTSGKINKQATCDRFNKHMSELVDNIPEISYIESACKDYLYNNDDLKDKITNVSYYDRQFLVDLFKTKNYNLLSSVIKSVFISADESLTEVAELEKSLLYIKNLNNQNINYFKGDKDKLEFKEDELVKKIDYDEVLTSSLILAIPEIFYLDMIEYHDYMSEFCELLGIDLQEIFEKISDIAYSSMNLKYVYTTLCYNDDFGKKTIELDKRLTMLIYILNQNNRNLYNYVIGCIGKKELTKTTNYELIAKIFDTKYFHDIDYNNDLYWILIEAFLILDSKNMLHLIDKDKIKNIDLGLFISGIFNTSNYNISVKENAYKIYNELIAAYNSNKDSPGYFFRGNKTIKLLHRSAECFEEVSNIVIHNKNYELFIKYAEFANKKVASKFISGLSKEDLIGIKETYDYGNSILSSNFSFVLNILPDLSGESFDAHSLNFAQKELARILSYQNTDFVINSNLNKKALCLLLSNYLKANSHLLSNDNTPNFLFTDKIVKLIEFLSDSISIRKELKDLVKFAIENGNPIFNAEIKETNSNQLKIIIDEII